MRQNTRGAFWDLQYQKLNVSCDPRGPAAVLVILFYPHIPTILRLNVGFLFFRIGVLQESLIKLVEACSDQSHSMDRWLSKLEASGWQSHVKEILTTACLAAQCIDRYGLSEGICTEPGSLQRHQPAANGRVPICSSQGGGVGPGSRHRGNRLHPASHVLGSDHPGSHLQDHQRLPGPGGARVAAGKAPHTDELDSLAVSKNLGCLNPGAWKYAI